MFSKISKTFKRFINKTSDAKVFLKDLQNFNRSVQNENEESEIHISDVQPITFTQLIDSAHKNLPPKDQELFAEKIMHDLHFGDQAGNRWDSPSEIPGIDQKSLDAFTKSLKNMENNLTTDIFFNSNETKQKDINVTDEDIEKDRKKISERIEIRAYTAKKLMNDEQRFKTARRISSDSLKFRNFLCRRNGIDNNKIYKLLKHESQKAYELDSMAYSCLDPNSSDLSQQIFHQEEVIGRLGSLKSVLDDKRTTDNSVITYDTDRMKYVFSNDPKDLPERLRNELKKPQLIQTVTSTIDYSCIPKVSFEREKIGISGGRQGGKINTDTTKITTSPSEASFSTISSTPERTGSNVLFSYSDISGTIRLSQEITDTQNFLKRGKMLPLGQSLSKEKTNNFIQLKRNPFVLQEFKRHYIFSPELDLGKFPDKIKKIQVKEGKLYLNDRQIPRKPSNGKTEGGSRGR